MTTRECMKKLLNTNFENVYQLLSNCFHCQWPATIEILLVNLAWEMCKSFLGEQHWQSCMNNYNYINWSDEIWWCLRTPVLHLYCTCITQCVSLLITVQLIWIWNVRFGDVWGHLQCIIYTMCVITTNINCSLCSWPGDETWDLMMFEDPAAVDPVSDGVECFLLSTKQAANSSTSTMTQSG